MRWWFIPNPIGKGWLCVSKKNASHVNKAMSIQMLVPYIVKPGGTIGVTTETFYRAGDGGCGKLNRKHVWGSPQSLVRALKKHRPNHPVNYKWEEGTIIIKTPGWKDTYIEVKPKGGVELCNHVQLT